MTLWCRERCHCRCKYSEVLWAGLLTGGVGSLLAGGCRCRGGWGALTGPGGCAAAYRSSGLPFRGQEPVRFRDILTAMSKLAVRYEATLHIAVSEWLRPF
jgi:hypothetical protein